MAGWLGGWEGRGEGLLILLGVGLFWCSLNTSTWWGMSTWWVIQPGEGGFIQPGGLLNLVGYSTWWVIQPGGGGFIQPGGVGVMACVVFCSEP